MAQYSSEIRNQLNSYINYLSPRTLNRNPNGIELRNRNNATRNLPILEQANFLNIIFENNISEPIARMLNERTPLPYLMGRGDIRRFEDMAARTIVTFFKSIVVFMLLMIALSAGFSLIR